MRTRSEPTPALLDQQRERVALDGLLGDVRSGRGRALVVRGEAGVGKSALLEYVAGAAAEIRVVRAAGAESVMELAFAGLHLLCVPLLGQLEGLPGPQRDALGVAFGLREGGAPDRFMVGLAVLTLLSEVAEERPLLCVVDDAQWLDRASAQVLAFAARRLLAEPVGLVFAAREPGDADELAGIPDLAIGGLGDDDARVLLDSVIPWRLDERVKARVIAQTGGNPLALLELPRGLSPAELEFGFGRPETARLSNRIEEGFLRQLQPLPDDTRRLCAYATIGPDEAAASDLDRAAAWARSRGGFAAAAALLERAIELTPGAAQRGTRALAAAFAKFRAADPKGALDLLATAELFPFQERCSNGFAWAC